jgi:DNA-binding response OmpR family regulator
MFRELHSVFLSRTGRVQTAALGEEGLRLARRDHPDLVIVDLHMPGMPGDVVCQEIKEDPDLHGTPVIVLVSGGDAEDRARAIRAGADDVLLKPLSRISLIETVQRFLRFRTPRGLPRVPVEAPVRLSCPQGEIEGTLRNVSRGGAFVEAPCDCPLASEIRLEFELPEMRRNLSATAKVIWCRDPEPDRLPGFGACFLSLDGRSARWIEEYVQERISPLFAPSAR